MTKNEEIAKTILSQLGGNRFLAMTGAKNLIAIENGLRMKIPRTRGIQYVQITLNAMDTYDMEFQKYHPKTFEKTVLAAENMIYDDMLQKAFTEHTGLYTRL